MENKKKHMESTQKTQAKAKTENGTSFVSTAQIEEWKAQYGHVYKTASGSQAIIYRPINRAEYNDLIDSTEIPYDQEGDKDARNKRFESRQTGVIKICTLYPKNIAEIVDRFGGLASTLSDEIMSHSGFNKLAQTEEL